MLFIVSFPIYGLSVFGKNLLSNFCTIFFAINSLALLLPSCQNVYVYFKSICNFILLVCLLSHEKKKKYLQKMWNADFKKQVGSTQEEIVSWKNILC